MPIRTGFEGYCAACGTVFGHVTDSFGDLPKVQFGAEIFGSERFLKDPYTRSRTWHLKGSKRGANNRLSVFEELWLTKARLRDVKAVEAQIEDVKARISAVRGFSSWVNKRRSEIWSALRTDGASKSTFDTSISKLQEEIAELIASLVTAGENGEVPFGRYGAFVADQCEWLEDFGLRLSGEAERSATMAETKSVLERARADLLGRKRELSSGMEELRNECGALVTEQERLEASLPDEAVSSCVSAMFDDRSSLLWHAMRADRYSFVNVFSTDVVPSIEEGFHAEVYPEERIAHFRHLMDDHMNKITVAHESIEALFREFLENLVFALVYGPRAAGAGAGTVWEDTFELALDEPSGWQILLTQLFTPDGRYLGKSRAFNADDVIFIGRSDELEAYVAKCTSILSKSEGEKPIFETRRPQLFTISEEHGQVSNLHGSIFCEEGTWVYLDFSRFGTRIVGKGKGGVDVDARAHGTFRELGPGSVLYLGARRTDADETRLFRKAAAVRLSYFLDEDNTVYNTL